MLFHGCRHCCYTLQHCAPSFTSINTTTWRRLRWISRTTAFIFNQLHVYSRRAQWLMSFLLTIPSPSLKVSLGRHLKFQKSGPCVVSVPTVILAKCYLIPCNRIPTSWQVHPYVTCLLLWIGIALVDFPLPIRNKNCALFTMQWYISAHSHHPV